MKKKPNSVLLGTAEGHYELHEELLAEYAERGNVQNIGCRGWLRAVLASGSETDRLYIRADRVLWVREVYS